MRLPTVYWWEEWQQMLAEVNPPPPRQSSQDVARFLKGLAQVTQQANLHQVRWGRRKHRR